MELRKRSGDFESVGARLVAVSPQTPHQAIGLRDERGVTDVPLLLDPDHRLRDRVGLGRLSLSGVLSPRGALNYLKSFGFGRRQGRIIGYNLQPGVIVADRSLVVVKTWKGKTYGDYPSVDDIFDVLRSLA